jgi:hypothetical protein
MSSPTTLSSNHLYERHAADKETFHWVQDIHYHLDNAQLIFMPQCIFAGSLPSFSLSCISFIVAHIGQYTSLESGKCLYPATSIHPHWDSNVVTHPRPFAGATFVNFWWLPWVSRIRMVDQRCEVAYERKQFTCAVCLPLLPWLGFDCSKRPRGFSIYHRDQDARTSSICLAKSFDVEASQTELITCLRNRCLTACQSDCKVRSMSSTICTLWLALYNGGRFETRVQLKILRGQVIDTKPSWSCDHGHEKWWDRQ